MSDIEKDRIDSCRDSFEEKYLQEYLDHVVESLGISSVKYCIKPGSKAGDNYIGIIYRVITEGEKNGEPVKIQMIFKVAPQDETMRLVLGVSRFFPRERLFYSEIVPLLKEFLSEKNKRLENIPECYFTSDAEKKEVICLEDLQEKGFLMRDRMKQMDFPHISLALRALGRLHALSFALRDQRPEIFASKIATLEETLHKSEFLTQPDFVGQFENIGDLIKTALAEEDPKYTERFSEFMKNAISKMEWSCRGDVAEPYAVLGHGDFWMNNMLFKYDEGSSVPKDIYLLDFQLARYASPAVDISYVLFCNCSQEVRGKYYDELIKIYHESLSTYLSELGSDPKKLFPYEALLNQLDKFSINGAGMAVMVLPAFTSKGQDTVNVSSGDFENCEIPALQKRLQRDHFWRNTMRDTFKDLIDRNYI